MLFSTFSLKFYFGIKFFLTVFPNNSSFLFVCLFVCLFWGGPFFRLTFKHHTAPFLCFFSNRIQAIHLIKDVISIPF